MKTRFFLGSTLLLSCALVQAAPLTESTFTDVYHTVEVVTPAKSTEPAQVNAIFKTPNQVRTGPNSRAELTAPDQTITRIGANTIFSFAPSGREVDLEQGSLLFHTPSGRGGGTIKSGGASAAVTGTTLIVSATPIYHQGELNGFKVILLEGTGLVKLPNGHSRRLHAGQLIFVLPGGADFGPLLTINLAKLVSGSTLIHGFDHTLPSIPLIEEAILHQEKLLDNGRASDTGTTADYYFHHPHSPFGLAHPGGAEGDPNIFQIGVLYLPVNNAAQNNPPFQHGPTFPGFDFPQYVPPVMSECPGQGGAGPRFVCADGQIMTGETSGGPSAAHPWSRFAP